MNMYIDYPLSYQGPFSRATRLIPTHSVSSSRCAPLVSHVHHSIIYISTFSADVERTLLILSITSNSHLHAPPPFA